MYLKNIKYKTRTLKILLIVFIKIWQFSILFVRILTKSVCVCVISLATPVQVPLSCFGYDSYALLLQHSFIFSHCLKRCTSFCNCSGFLAKINFFLYSPNRIITCYVISRHSVKSDKYLYFYYCLNVLLCFCCCHVAKFSLISCQSCLAMQK